MSDSLANAVEILANQIDELDELAPTAETVRKLRRQMLQLVGNYRRRRDAGPPLAEIRGFRIFRRHDATLPGGETGAAVWFCSGSTPDTFGVVVGAPAAEHFELNFIFKLVPDE